MFYLHRRGEEKKLVKGDDDAAARCPPPPEGPPPRGPTEQVVALEAIEVVGGRNRRCKFRARRGTNLIMADLVADF